MEKSEAQAACEKRAHRKREWVYKGRIISLAKDTYDLAPNQPVKTADTVVHPGAVAILPIHSDGNLILIKQWRRATDRILIEIPAGTLEAGEPPLACAQRELQEEIGYRAEKLTELGGFFTAPGFCSEYIHLFFAEGLQHSQLEGDEDEMIDLFPVSLERALALIESGEICDAKTIVAILRYLQKSQRG